MDLELIPPFVIPAEFILVFAGIWIYRHRKMKRMSPQQRMHFLKSEREHLD